MTTPTYVVGIGEVLYGGMLLAATLAMHGCGVLVTLRSIEALRRRTGRRLAGLAGIGIVIVASWMLVLLHLLEVIVWAGFYLWHDAVNTPDANASIAYYFALMEYTTIGSAYNLKLDWRLLEGMNGIAGLLTFAWSTSVLLTLAEAFQQQRLPAVEGGGAGRDAAAS
ncbi:MAG: hypothetical protein J0L57_05440 [Burkholderiales bacterium]|nr:hypothetical protein [Burkholderiales bacterium]